MERSTDFTYDIQLSRTAQASQHLAETSAQLTIAADQASKAIQQIAQTIEEMTQGTAQQTSLVSGATTNTEQMMRVSAGIARGAQEHAKLVQKTSRLIGDVISQMDQVAQTIVGASAKVTKATHARRTAEVTTDAWLASDTSRSLDEILRAADGATNLAKRITRSVEDVKRKSTGVVVAIEMASMVVEETTVIAEQMVADSREMADAMEGVGSVAEGNSATAKGMAVQVDEVVTSAHELVALAKELRRSVAQFRVA
jgi:methyl-accepting chemotaxis protein